MVRRSFWVPKFLEVKSQVLTVQNKSSNTERWQNGEHRRVDPGHDCDLEGSALAGDSVGISCEADHDVSVVGNGRHRHNRAYTSK